MSHPISRRGFLTSGVVAAAGAGVAAANDLRLGSATTTETVGGLGNAINVGSTALSSLGSAASGVGRGVGALNKAGFFT